LVKNATKKDILNHFVKQFFRSGFIMLPIKEQKNNRKSIAYEILIGQSALINGEESRETYLWGIIVKY